LLTEGDAAFRCEVAGVLGELGPAAEPAVPALTAALSDPSEHVIPGEEWKDWDGTVLGGTADTVLNVAESAAAALGRVGPAATDALIGALSHPRGPVRESAVRSLARPEFRAGADAILPALRRTAVTRGDYAGTLAGVAWLSLSARRNGDGAKPLPDTLSAAMSDPEPAIRLAALRAMSVGDVEPPAVPVRLRAVAAAAAAPRIIEMLNDPDDEVRLSAARLLAGVGAAAEPAVPRLAGMLSSEADPERVRCLIGVLRELGPTVAGGALPAALELLRRRTKGEEDPSDRVTGDLIGLIGSFGPAAAPAVPLLRELLSIKTFAWDVSVAWALGQIGAAASEAIPDLEAALPDRRWAAYLNGPGPLYREIRKALAAIRAHPTAQPQPAADDNPKKRRKAKPKRGAAANKAGRASRKRG
jgi:HEAT repeat protein